MSDLHEAAQGIADRVYFDNRLTFEVLAAKNYSRCLRWHPGGLAQWSLSDWAVAMVGEAGELCNVVKKLNRVRDGMVGNRETPAELQAALGKEAADICIYLDLVCQSQGISLADAVRNKFNEVSVRNGFPERL